MSIGTSVEDETPHRLLQHGGGPLACVARPTPTRTGIELQVPPDLLESRSCHCYLVIQPRQISVPQQEAGQLSLELTARREKLDELEYFAKRYLDPLQHRLRTVRRPYDPDKQDASKDMLFRIADKYICAQFSIARTQFYQILSLNNTYITYEYLARYISEYKIVEMYLIDELPVFLGNCLIDADGLDEWKQDDKSFRDALRELRANPKHGWLDEALNGYRMAVHIRD